MNHTTGTPDHERTLHVFPQARRDIKVKVGDIVLIRAKVIDDDALDPEETRVELQSKQTPFKTRITLASIHGVLLDNRSDEPPDDGTYLVVFEDDPDVRGDDSHDDSDRQTRWTPRVFWRHDTNDTTGTRRWPLRWFDVKESQWIDWPEAAARGAARGVPFHPRAGIPDGTQAHRQVDCRSHGWGQSSQEGPR